MEEKRKRGEIKEEKKGKKEGDMRRRGVIKGEVVYDTLSKTHFHQ